MSAPTLPFLSVSVRSYLFHSCLLVSVPTSFVPVCAPVRSYLFRSCFLFFRRHPQSLLAGRTDLAAGEAEVMAAAVAAAQARMGKGHRQRKKVCVCAGGGGGGGGVTFMIDQGEARGGLHARRVCVWGGGHTGNTPGSGYPPTLRP